MNKLPRKFGRNLKFSSISALVIKLCRTLVSSLLFNFSFLNYLSRFLSTLHVPFSRFHHLDNRVFVLTLPPIEHVCSAVEC
jgi:hypothetical protein